MEIPHYAAPETVGEAVALLRADPEARVLAGATDVLVQMRTGRLRPTALVDVKRIPELMRIEVESGGVRIGAAVPAAEIVEHAEVRRRWPGLHEATHLIGSTQIQGRATLCGNLCNGSPAADTVPPLIAVRAGVRVAGPEGERSVAAEDFITAPGETVLRPGEIVVAFLLPNPPARSADAYLRFIPRTEMDIAVVGAAVAVTLDADGSCADARVAIGAVAPRPLLVPEAAQALVDSRLDADALERAGLAARAAADPIDDVRGTAAYRRRVTAVLVRRAAAIAAGRAREA